MKLNKKQFQLWIDALRSGDYKQTKETLEDSMGYCCLGVACKVLVPEDKLKLDQIVLGGIMYGQFPEHQPNAPKWLKEINSDFGHKFDRQLIDLNDEDKLSFEQIADALEAVYVHKVNFN